MQVDEHVNAHIADLLLNGVENDVPKSRDANKAHEVDHAEAAPVELKTVLFLVDKSEEFLKAFEEVDVEVLDIYVLLVA